MNSRRSNLLATLFLGFTWVCLPNPVFGQHGGGGMSGGGHAGGGSAHASSAGHATGHGVAHGTTAGSTPRGGGTFVAPSIGMGGSSAGSSAGRGFRTGSTVWVAPPKTGSARPARFISESRGGASGAFPGRGPLIGMNPVPSRVFLPRRTLIFFDGGCFNGFFPGFCGFGPGFFGFAWGWPWDASGFAEMDSFGYPFSPSMSGEIESRVENQPQYYEAAPYGFQYQYPPSESESGSQAGGEVQMMMLYLKDGSVYGLLDYWIAGGKLHYATTYGAENSVEMDRIDLQKTVEVNARRGVPFLLRPGPAPNGPTDTPPKPPE